MPQPRQLRTMDDILLAGKDVLVRVDFNVSVGDDQVVDKFEDYRIEATIPTITELIQRRCRVILLTHLGRPGQEKGNFSLAPLHRRLTELLNEEIRLVSKLTGPKVNAVVDSMTPGSVVLLPNVREDDRETNKNQGFAQELANVAAVYVNEAFSVSHRDHTSLTLLPRILPSCAGRRTVLEYNTLTRLALAPPRPYVAIVSGAKVKTKVNLITALLNQVDYLCVGGVIANTFLAAAGKYPGWVCPSEEVKKAQQIMAQAKGKIILPLDVVIGSQDKTRSTVETVSVDNIPANAAGVWDVGAKTVAHYLSYCAAAKTVMWNGPLGKFEDDRYALGTTRLARGLADSPAKVFVGGGDTSCVIERLNAINKFEHVSVGGGAMLALLEGASLPGLEPLFV